MTAVTVYICIGNSDDKLTQEEWSDFIKDIRAFVIRQADHVWGEWFSAPDSRYQNACWGVEFSSEDDAAFARSQATRVRKQYGQDSVAWAVVPETGFA